MFKCFYRVTQGQRKEVQWKLKKDRNLKLNYTYVILKREVGKKYNKQSARRRGHWHFMSCKTKKKILEVGIGNSIKG